MVLRRLIGKLKNYKERSVVGQDRYMKKGIIVLAVCMLVSFTGCGNLVKKGTAYLEKENYEDAKEVFQKAIEKEEDVAEAYRGLGIAYMEQEEYEEALWAFEKALGEGTEETAVLDNLVGICGMKCGQYKKAASFFEKGSKLEDGTEALNQEMAWNLVVSYEKLGDYQRAKDKLEEYLSSYPEDEKALKEREFLNTQS